MEIRVTKEGSDHPKRFDFPDLDYEDSMAVVCSKLDEMHSTNGFLFEVLDATPIIAQHYFGEDGLKCVQCLKHIAEFMDYGTKEMPTCVDCFTL